MSPTKVVKVIVGAVILLVLFQTCSWSTKPKTAEEFAQELNNTVQTVRSFLYELEAIQKDSNFLHDTFELEVVPIVKDVKTLLHTLGVDVKELEKQLDKSYNKINSSAERFIDDLESLIYSARFISENLKVNSSQVMPSTLDYFIQFNKDLVTSMRMAHNRIHISASAAANVTYHTINTLKDKSARSELVEKFSRVEKKVAGLWRELIRYKTNYDRHNVLVIKALKNVIPHNIQFLK